MKKDKFDAIMFLISRLYISQAAMHDIIASAGELTDKELSERLGSSEESLREISEALGAGGEDE